MFRVRDQILGVPPATLTEHNCPDQAGRVFVVTGGYTGIGFELTQILYAHNATVYIAGRSPSKASDAISRIKSAHSASLGRLECLIVDLADLATVKSAVDSFMTREHRLDVLVNNAGVMFPPEGSKDAHGNELMIGTNCLGPYLLYKLLEPMLAKTAIPSSPGSVRVAWAGSIAVDVQSPYPGGMTLDGEGRPLDRGTKMDYGQSKVGNLFMARRFAATTKETGVVHVAFNPGNIRTELQRHWQGLEPWVLDKFFLYPAVNGAYTELFSVLSPEITTEQSGAYILPFGRLGGLRTDVEAALKTPSDGGTGEAARFMSWCEKQTKLYM